MSAPHPTAIDTADPTSLMLFKPRHCIPVNDASPEAEPIAVNLASLEEEIGRNLLAEIASIMRRLTWGEMMELSEGINTPADTLHKWSKER